MLHAQLKCNSSAYVWHALFFCIDKGSFIIAPSSVTDLMLLEAVPCWTHTGKQIYEVRQLFVQVVS
jgi:hypothetical protein